MRPFSLSFVALTLAASLSAAGAEPDLDKDAQAIVRRAIKAHGGAGKLARTRIMRETTRGTLLVMGTKVPFTSETVVRMPDQFRNVLTSEVGGRKRQVVQVFNGTKGWTSENGVPRAVGAGVIGNWKEMAHAAHVAMLTPLLAADKGYTLSALGESAVGGRKAVGVKVSIKGRNDVRLYFDKETGLLVKKSFQPGDGKESVRDEVYSHFKEFEGLNRHTRTTVLLGGKPHAEAERLSLEFLERVDDKEFDKP
ncbi:MAG: hypothetical protein HYS12_23455 [Planctomycetes bacterium]|nr:hypothetical protein [Planctomycetota bacterium]